MDKYLILPGCDDGNRGDQALVWETKRIAEEAGFLGEFKMLCSPELVMGSKEVGIENVLPILQHPSRKFKKNDNRKYSFGLLIKWGSVAIGDYISSKLLLCGIFRKIFVRHLSKEVQNTVAYMQECKACFVKGGGFLHSYGGMTDIYQMYYFLYHINLAHSLGVPVYVMPNSYGPFNAPTVRYQVAKALNKCLIVTSRESISNTMIRDVGVNALQYPDLAFSLKKSKNNIPEIEELLSCAGKRKCVAITARPYRFPGISNPEKAFNSYINALSEFCNWLYDEDYYPVLVEHVIANGSNESDLFALNEIVSKLDDNKYYLFTNHNYNCQDLKQLYSNMFAVVGTRFHSVIFSLSESIPCIAITYGGNKGEGIMRDMKLSDYSISMEEVSLNTLKSMFQKLAENYVEYKDVLTTSLDQYRTQRNELVSLLNSKKQARESVCH